MLRQILSQTANQTVQTYMIKDNRTRP